MAKAGPLHFVVRLFHVQPGGVDVNVEEISVGRPPHCDSRILHAPGACVYCDARPDLQRARVAMAICFTGEPVDAWHGPCPADFHRPPDSPADHRRWDGNIARPRET